MIQIKHLNIPQPCAQDWNHMTATESGRHCQSCSKTVVDFTRMSNDEIINYLARNSKTCGRFHEAQLQGINNQLSYNSKPDTRWRKLLMTAILFGSAIFNEANGQSKAALPQKTEQVPLAPGRTTAY
jgi:DNA primase catalytic subunit